MKLFKIYQDVNNDYDTFDSAIVAANDEEDARKISPRGDIVPEVRPQYGTWCALSEVKVEYIGEAKEGTEQGVICASFNAG